MKKTMHSTLILKTSLKMQNLGGFAHLKENDDAFWTKQVKEVGSVPLSARIYLQKRKTLECGHPNSSPTACGGPSGGLQG